MLDVVPQLLPGIGRGQRAKEGYSLAGKSYPMEAKSQSKAGKRAARKKVTNRSWSPANFHVDAPIMEEYPADNLTSMRIG